MLADESNLSYGEITRMTMGRRQPPSRAIIDILNIIMSWTPNAAANDVYLAQNYDLNIMTQVDDFELLPVFPHLEQINMEPYRGRRVY